MLAKQSRGTAAPTAERQWQPTPNAAVAFIANNSLHACAHGNTLTGLACGVAQGLWNGSWTLRDNVWSNVVDAVGGDLRQLHR